MAEKESPVQKTGLYDIEILYNLFHMHFVSL